MSKITSSALYLLTDTDSVTSTKTIVSSDSGSNSRSSSSLSAIQKNLFVYVAPIVFVFGMLGNCLTIAVMLRKRYSGSSVRMFMLLLAVFDSTVLVCAVPPEWLTTVIGVKIKEIHPVVCQLDRLLYYTAGDSSIWTLCAFTADRFVAVCWPFLKQNTYFSKNTWLVSLILLAVSTLKNLHVFWSRGRQFDIHGNVTSNCGYRTEFANFEEYVRPWIVFVTVSVIPFFTLLFCNIMIVRALIASERIRKAHGGNTATSSRGGKRSFLQTTFMCLSVSFAFLIFMVPSIILYIGRPYWGRKDSYNFAYDMARTINKLMVCVNHSISFWLYCLTGRAFRRELSVMLRCCCCRRKNPTRRRMSENNSQAAVTITMRRLNVRYEHRIIQAVPDDATLT